MGNCSPSDFFEKMKDITVTEINESELKRIEKLIKQNYIESKKIMFNVVNPGCPCPQGIVKHAFHQLPKQILEIQPSAFEKSKTAHKQYASYPDTRKPANCLEYPYTAIGLVIAYFQEGKKSFGTGFIIGEHCIMTCAHNLFPDNKMKAIKIDFYPATDGIQGTHYKVKTYHYPKEFINSQEIQSVHDYALLTVDENIGRKYGYLGVDFSEKFDTSQEFSIFGYPGIIYPKGKPHGQSAQKKQYGASGKISIQGKMIKYEIHTSRGQSGSPIFYKKDNQYYVVGCHICGQKNGGNTSILFTSQIYKQLSNWTEHNEGSLVLSNKKLDQQFLQVLSTHKFAFLGNLINLKLEQNQLTFQTFKNIPLEVGFNGLEVLSVSNNSIGNEGFGLFCKRDWSSIRELNFGGNKITCEGIQSIRTTHWNNLQNLYLFENQIESQGLLILKEMKWKYLQLLSVTKNQIGDLGITKKTFENWPMLSWLYLSHNQIGDEGAEFLIDQEKWPSLSTLTLSNNPRISLNTKQKLKNSKLRNEKHHKIEIKI